jgi:hypothetical protein
MVDNQKEEAMPSPTGLGALRSEYLYGHSKNMREVVEKCEIVQESLLQQ